MSDMTRLMAAARLAMAETVTPFACGIVNVKAGGCQEDCAFCSQSVRADHADATQSTSSFSHGFDDDGIFRRAEAMYDTGLAYMGLVAAGRRPTLSDLDRYCRIADRLTTRVDIRLCASFGLLSPEEAVRLKSAGFTSYHHNLETSRSFFPRICTTHSYDERLATIRNARAAGLRVCSGGIFGCGESWSDRDDLARMLAELEVDSVPINFLSPLPGTPLAGRSTLSPAEALEIIARFRLALPGKDIIICGGRPGALGESDRLIFAAGANALMTGDYLTTPGCPPSRDRELFAAVGLVPFRR
ncbi:MAG: biotin synthase BioB [Phycisphaerales bacterium]|nr:biotin synthase BioB [Phycisphaerales bacterium]